MDVPAEVSKLLYRMFILKSARLNNSLKNITLIILKHLKNLEDFILLFKTKNIDFI